MKQNALPIERYAPVSILDDNDSRGETHPATKRRALLPIGAYLLEEELITRDQLDIALHEQAQQDALLGSLLIRMGFIGEDAFAFALARRSGIPVIDLEQNGPDPRLTDLLPQTLCAKHLALPIKQTGQTLTLAMADPLDLVALDALARALPRQIRIAPCAASRRVLEELIGSCLSHEGTIDALLRTLEKGEAAEAAEGYEHPVIQLVNLILDEAIRQEASDIHFEPEGSFVRIRYRIDGVLRPVRDLHLTHWPALSHRLKIMAGMNIANKRSIQDGRFQRAHNGKTIDFRAAIMPGVWGETIVVRLLDHGKALIALGKLGYTDEAERKLRQMAQKPQGIILLTGPTGSGKTTTLYSLLQTISSPDIHIATLEEPVEYQLPLLRQTSIQEAQGIDFAAGVRGLLRMDPDVILIGEIRDPDTAQMALRAAMTGHQVYSTLHCNDVFGALPRLLDLGLSARTLAGNLGGIVAQRLVRKLCPHCKRSVRASEEEARLLGHDPAIPLRLATAIGCEACSHTGRLGRVVIAEVLPISTAMNTLIAAEAPRYAIIEQAQREGFVSLLDDGLSRVRAGEVAFDDLRRAVDLTDMEAG